MNIQNKVVIITGGVGGIATATTQILLNLGAKYVALFDLKETESHGQLNIKKFEQEFGEGCVGFYANDVRNQQDFAERYDEVLKSHKSVDILINNAGICNDKDVDSEIDTNFKATVTCTLTAIDRMGVHHGGNGGSIINISSADGLIFHDELPIYVATKHAVIGFTGSLKSHYNNLAVRVMAICPGLTSTSLIRKENLKTVDFVDEVTAFTQFPAQSPKNVGLAISKLIEKGEAGDIWVVEKDNPPFAVNHLEFHRDKGVPIP